MSIPYSDDLPWCYGLRLSDLYDGILDLRVCFPVWF